MSIIIKGDGSNTSSVAFDNITLSVAPSQDVMRDNVRRIEGDGGHTFNYERGTYKRIFPLRLRLLPDADRLELWIWWQVIRGRNHWFTIHPNNQPVAWPFTQQYGAGSDIIVRNNQLTQGDDYWKGYWLFVLTGAATGQRRKVKDFYSSNDELWFDRKFDNPIGYGDQVLLAYPVEVMDQEIRFIARLPTFKDVNLNLIEKLLA